MSKLTRKDLDEMFAQGCLLQHQYDALLYMLKIEPRKDEVRPMGLDDYFTLGALVIVALAIAYYIGVQK